MSLREGTRGARRQVAQWKLGCVSMFCGLSGVGCKGELMKIEMFWGP